MILVSVACCSEISVNDNFFLLHNSLISLTDELTLSLNFDFILLDKKDCDFRLLKLSSLSDKIQININLI